MGRRITHPSGDTYSLLRATASLQGFFYVKNQYIIHWREDSADPGGSFFGQQQRNTYLLSLPLLKIVPEQLRLKAAQSYNMLFLLIFTICFYNVLKQILGGTAGQEKIVATTALLFTLLIASRIRILLLVVFGLTDMLNYMLMVIELFFLQQYLQSASPAPLVTVGFICGLACRNRVQDILRACSYFLFFLMTGAPVYHLLFFVGTILALHWDTFFLTVHQEKKTVRPVLPIIHQTLTHTPPDAPQKPFIQTACANIGNGLLAMINVYDKQSLWPVLGGLMLLSPLSLLVIVHKQEYPTIFLLFAIYAILLCGSCFFFKHRIYMADKAPESHYYFSGRQMTILIPLAALFNAQAFYLLWRDGHDLALLPYICYVIAHLAHQLFRLIGYSKNGFLEETKFDLFPFKPPSWQVALGKFVRDRQEPLVLLGSHLNFGEVYNFFDWSPTKRFVDVYCRLSVTRLLEFIQRYGVTHIALTPASCFNSGYVDAYGNIISPLLHGVLIPIPQTVPNLHLFAVKHAQEQCQAKEFYT